MQLTWIEDRINSHTGPRIYREKMVTLTARGVVNETKTATGG
jgi:hypothetical protein